MRGRSRSDGRAVSEVIGFIIIFGIVVTSIGIVYYNAVPGLENAREVEQVENTQRAFSILQDNIDDVAVRDAPSRTTEVNMNQGSVELGEVGLAEINATADGDTLNVTPTGFRPLLYDSPTNVNVVYESGAVLASDAGGGSGMVYAPNWRVTEDEVVISTVRVTGGVQSASGTASVRIRAEEGGSNMQVLEDVTELNVTVKSPRSEGWLMYMERFDHTEDTGRIDNETVYVEVRDLQRVMYIENEVSLEIIG